MKNDINKHSQFSTWTASRREKAGVRDERELFKWKPSSCQWMEVRCINCIYFDAFCYVSFVSMFAGRQPMYLFAVSPYQKAKAPPVDNAYVAGAFSGRKENTTWPKSERNSAIVWFFIVVCGRRQFSSLVAGICKQGLDSQRQLKQRNTVAWWSFCSEV